MSNIFHIYNLKRKIQDCISNEIADRIIPIELIKGDKKSPEEKASIMNGIIEKMEKELDHDSIRKIRKKTSCGITQRQKEIIIIAKKTGNNLIEQCEIINNKIAPSSIKMIDNKLIFTFGYNKCICRMFNKVNNAKSTKSFCYCCAGNVEKIVSYWLGRNIEMEIVETFLIGNNDCSFVNKE